MSLTGQIDAVQDAVKAALDTRAATVGAPLHTAAGAGMTGQVPVDLGTPPDIQPEHVWVLASASVSEAERIPLTTGTVVAGGDFLGEFRVEVVIYVQLSGTYLATRNRNTVLAADVEGLLKAATFPTTAGLLDGYIEAIDRDAAAVTGDAMGVLTTIRYFCRSDQA